MEGRGPALMVLNRNQLDDSAPANEGGEEDPTRKINQIPARIGLGSVRIYPQRRQRLKLDGNRVSTAFEKRVQEYR